MMDNRIVMDVRARHSLSRWALFVLASTAASQSAYGRTLFKPPSGVWLAPSDRSGQLYGPTSPAANWTVGQWNIPQDLPPFKNGFSANDDASVRHETSGSFLLSQDGDTLSCTKSYGTGLSDVHEFDLFLQPINANMPKFPRADIGPPVTLGAAQSIFEEINVQPTFVYFDNFQCPVTRFTMQAAVVLVNTSRHQVIFYQLRLGSTGRGTSSLGTLSPPFWYSKGLDKRSGQKGSFGYDDNITSYNEQPVSIGVESHYRLDLLARLKSVIIEGEKYGLDQVYGDWVIRGAYEGDIVWGHTRASSRWSPFSIDVQ
jgi:hypothetical protein